MMYIDVIARGIDKMMNEMDAEEGHTEFANLTYEQMGVEYQRRLEAIVEYVANYFRGNEDARREFNLD